MLKLKRYLKPYLGLLLAAVALLFGQAMLELALPDYMSRIVNVGLMQGGLTQAAPEVMDGNTMALMERFMTEEDRTALEGAYVPLGELPEGEQEALLDRFPGADRSTLALTADPALGAEEAFCRAGYALASLVQEAPSLDMERLAQMIQDPAVGERVEEAVALAALTPASVTAQTGILFTKNLYAGLGADTDGLQTRYIRQVGLQMAVLAVLLTVCAISAGLCLAKLGAGVGRDLRRDIFRRVTEFGSGEMAQFSTSSLITRTTNDVNQIQHFLSMGFRMVCFAPIMGVGGLIMGFSTCAELSWVLALALIVMLGLVLLLFSLVLPRFRRMQGLIDRLNLVSREELGGMMVVRAFSNQKFMQDRFEESNKALNDNVLFVNRTMSAAMPVMTLVMNGVCLLIVWFGGQQIARSNMQVGDMMAFIQYAMNVIMSFLFIAMMFVMVPRASVAGDRIYEVLSTENQVADPASPKPLPRPIRGTVAFEDVSFRYSGADETVLEHISFTARPGETVAIIGPTGCGKSTLVDLLPRFHDVTAGRITLDGVDIRDLSLRDLREAMGYVPQKGHLFSGTVESNLRYGREDASQELLRESVRVAQAAELIESLEGGMEAPISQSGKNVSGGQRQRLSIARALVKNAPIYIFDDAFSALDFKTDAKLRGALRQYTGNSTVFMVAQRVATIMQADQILVLDQGRVVGRGTHKQLLRSCPVYREIAESQLRKEELE